MRTSSHSYSERLLGSVPWREVLLSLWDGKLGSWGGGSWDGKLGSWEAARKGMMNRVIHGHLIPRHRNGRRRSLINIAHHLRLWLLIGRDWEMSQSNSSKMFAFGLRGPGAKAFFPPARIDGRRRETERGGWQGPGTLPRAQGIELILQVCYRSFPSTSPTGDNCMGRWGRGECFLWAFLAEEQSPQENRRQSSPGTQK